MSTCAVNQIQESCDVSNFPDGVFEGIWDENIVSFRVGSRVLTGVTNIKIQDTNAPCIVTVKDHKVFVKLKSKEMI